MKNHIVFVVVFLLLVSAFAATASASAWKFVATGDSRGDDNGVNTEILGEIANAIAAEGDVELVVVPGDIITSGGSSRFQHWRDTMAPVYDAGIAVYPIRGNHDDDSDSAWIDKFGDDIPDNGPSDAVDFTYYVEHNNALFIGFDNYIDSSSYDLIPAVWMNNVFAANTKPHIFTFAHQPAFKVDHTSGLQDNTTERNAFVVDLLEAGGRVYFCGHDHFLDILRADDGDGDSDNDFIQYLVGTAGAPLRNTEPYNGNNGPYTPIHIEHSKSYGYTIVEIDGSTVTMTYKKRMGTNDFQPFHEMSYSIASDIGFSGQTTIELEKHEAGQIEVDVFSLIDQTFDWTITGQSDYSWITNVSPSTGTSTGQTDTTTVTIDIDAAGLTPGDYTCELLLEADSGDINIIPVALTVYDRVDLEEFTLLAQYWMDDCGDVDDCIAADWYINGTIDTLDLRQLALSWLGEEAMYIYVPISHWQFDEQSGSLAADSVGDKDGTVYGTAGWQPTGGYIDGALDFNGTDTYVGISGYKGITGSAPRTCTAWIKAMNTGDAYYTIMSWGNDNPGGCWFITLNGNSSSGNMGALRLAVVGGTVTGIRDLRDDTWHHVAVVLPDDGTADVSEALLYVDGLLETIDYSVSFAINTGDTTGGVSQNDVLIGKLYRTGQEHYFDGLIDDVRIYDCALSSQEIAEMAQ